MASSFSCTRYESPGVRRSPTIEGPQIALAAALELVELPERILDVASSAFEVRAPVVDLVQHIAELARLAPWLVIQVDDRADLLEREAEPLAAQDQVEPGAVAPVVDAHRRTTLGGDEAEVLVVADRPVRDGELVADLRDRPRRPA